MVPDCPTIKIRQLALPSGKRMDRPASDAERYYSTHSFCLLPSPSLRDSLLVVCCQFALGLLLNLGFDYSLIHVCSAPATNVTGGADAPRNCCDYGRIQRNLTVPHGYLFSRWHPEIWLYNVGCLDSGSAGVRQALLRKQSEMQAVCRPKEPVPRAAHRVCSPHGQGR